MFNVKDFGAAGDGSTSDYDRVQATIDAASASGGGVVYFPPGHYNLTRPMMITTSVTLASNVTLRGSGIANTVLKIDTPTSDNVAVLVSSSNFTGVENLTIQDLTLDGGQVEAPGPEDERQHCHGLALRQSRNVLIQRVRVINCGGDGISISNGTLGLDPVTDHVMASNCSFEHCWRFGLGVQRFSNNVIVRNCSFRDIATFMLKAENDYSTGSDSDNLLTGLEITGCHFESVDPENESGKAIGIIGNTHQTFKDVRISNNIIHGIIEVERTKRLLIEGNTILGINNSPSSTSNRSCVHLDQQAEDVTIRNNILRWSSSGGIGLFRVIPTSGTESKRIVIANNLLIDDSTETETEYGHGVQARRASAFMVNGNILLGNGYRDGVRLDPELGMSEVQVLDNQIAAVQHGVAVHETEEASEDLARLDLSGNAVMEVSEGGAALAFGASFVSPSPS